MQALRIASVAVATLTLTTLIGSTVADAAHRSGHIGHRSSAVSVGPVTTTLGPPANAKADPSVLAPPAQMPGAPSYSGPPADMTMPASGVLPSTQVTAPAPAPDPVSTASGAQPSTYAHPGGGGATLADCMALWDRSSHMTRSEWRITCHRTLNAIALSPDLEGAASRAAPTAATAASSPKVSTGPAQNRHPR